MALQARGRPLNGQQIEKVECKALNVKAPMNGLSAFDILLYVPLRALSWSLWALR